MNWLKRSDSQATLTAHRFPNLLTLVTALTRKDIPVRWFIIDPVMHALDVFSEFKYLLPRCKFPHTDDRN